MTSKKFVQITVLCILSSLLGIFSLILYVDEFGLFWNNNDKKIRIFGDERKAKHLLTYKYIPKNFDGVLIGPSLSALEMDTRKIYGYKIYNLSINGGNISELKMLMDNLYNNGSINYVVICITPYITKDSDQKTTSINDKNYMSVFGSIDLLKYYLSKVKALYFSKNDKFMDSYSGNSKSDISVHSLNSKNIIIENKDKILKSKYYKLEIDDTAINELNELLVITRQKNVKIFGYFHPIAYDIYDIPFVKEEYGKYKNTISQMFNDNDAIWDFNQKKYNYIRNEYDTYSDGVHLTEKGANKILKEIKVKLDNYYLHKNKNENENEK